MTIQPDPPWKKLLSRDGKSPDGARLLLRLVRECWQFRGRLLPAVSALLALAGTRLYLTWLVKLWAEGPLVTGDTADMVRLFMLSTAVTGGMVVAVFFSLYMLSSVNQRMLQSLRNKAHYSVIRADMRKIREYRAGDLYSRVFNDIGLLSGFVGNVFQRMLGETCVAVGSIVMMFYLNWRLALTVIIVVPMAALMLAGITGIVRRWAESAQTRLGALSAVFTEQVRGISTIKGYRTEDFEHGRFARINRVYRQRFLRGDIWSAALLSIIWLITGLGLLCLIWYGTRQVMSGEITAGALLAFCLYAGQTVEPVRKLSDVHVGLQRTMAAAGRIFQVLDLYVVKTDGGLSISHPARGALQFEHVRFRYKDDESLFEDLDFRIEPQETVAIVAASGGGKSTLARLLLRFWDANAGRILLDGADLKDLSLSQLRNAICVVEQDPFIFSGLLEDNIRYGSWEASAAEIERAADLACLGPLVESLPRGLHASLEEGGQDLSGGQKQRIALARAIVRDPAVLVLDEATSAIDSDTEREIFQRIAGWLTRRTVLLMAHRLSTVSRFDRIVMIEGGTVAGDGSVSQLVRECPPFRRLFHEQFDPLKAADTD
ncbi:MAG: ABC transporter ATP-binding protein [Deltaproteobacteria bacterium]|nr:ABC transporter ATP-binding protein [Deltaproteobacteria bacterium]MBW1818575.1 ABC transporter ATP-binding protein [Deltaproteobacteria bacterium]